MGRLDLMSQISNKGKRVPLPPPCFIYSETHQRGIYCEKNFFKINRKQEAVGIGLIGDLSLVQ